MQNLLPPKVFELFKKYPKGSIDEIRLRVNKPTYFLVNGRFLRQSDLATITQAEMQALFIKLTGRSVYAHADTVKRGYITTEQGIRIGLGGACVTESGQVRFIREISSLCIRIPRQVIGVAETLFKNEPSILSTLIISPPGCGKTTMLRDCARIASKKFNLNVLVVDEKNELSGGKEGAFDLGDTTDVLNLASKEFGFMCGVLNLRPDLIIADELKDEQDAKGAIFAALSGVFVFASAHGKSLEDIIQKKELTMLFDKKIFKRVVVLSQKNGVGTIEEIIRL